MAENKNSHTKLQNSWLARHSGKCLTLQSHWGRKEIGDWAGLRVEVGAWQQRPTGTLGKQRQNHSRSWFGRWLCTSRYDSQLVTQMLHKSKFYYMWINNSNFKERKLCFGTFKTPFRKKKICAWSRKGAVLLRAVLHVTNYRGRQTFLVPLKGQSYLSIRGQRNIQPGNSGSISEKRVHSPRPDRVQFVIVHSLLY